MLVWVLTFLNIPSFIFVGWVLFDTKDSAAETFFETTVTILKIALVPPIIRHLLSWDDLEAFGIFSIAPFFVACAAIVYAEHWLIVKFLLS